MTTLAEHARRELELAGLFDGDSDYGGMIGPAVMEVIEVFASQGHSGASISIAGTIVHELLQRKTLTPLTYGPEEWEDRSEISGYPLWQNVRDSSVFSRDGGATHFKYGEEPE